MDCSEKFQPGPYGIPAAELKAEQLTNEGDDFIPIYLIKNKTMVEDSTTCKYVGAFDVFELDLKTESGSLLAGCYADFNGDGDRDYAPLLQHRADSSLTAVYVFIKEDEGFRNVFIDSLGFDDYERTTWWMGPYCRNQSQNGEISGVEGYATERTVGDTFQLGWFAYYWDPESRNFKSIQIFD